MKFGLKIVALVIGLAIGSCSFAWNPKGDETELLRTGANSIVADYIAKQGGVAKMPDETLQKAREHFEIALKKTEKARKEIAKVGEKQEKELYDKVVQWKKNNPEKNSDQEKASEEYRQWSEYIAPQMKMWLDQYIYEGIESLLYGELQRRGL